MNNSVSYDSNIPDEITNFLKDNLLNVTQQIHDVADLRWEADELENGVTLIRLFKVLVNRERILLESFTREELTNQFANVLERIKMADIEINQS